MLAGRLRELEGQQMLTRTQYPEIPPRVEYALTGKGRPRFRRSRRCAPTARAG